MTNKDVTTAFLNGRAANTTNLHSTGDKLFSYNTCIAQWDSDTLIGNATKYSTTTSIHMSSIKPYVDKWTIKKVPIGVNSLTDYINKII